MTAALAQLITPDRRTALVVRAQANLRTPDSARSPSPDPTTHPTTGDPEHRQTTLSRQSRTLTHAPQEDQQKRCKITVRPLRKIEARLASNGLTVAPPERHATQSLQLPVTAYGQRLQVARSSQAETGRIQTGNRK